MTPTTIVPRFVHMTLLTEAAPAANCRGEREESRIVLQKLPLDDGDHAVLTSPAQRNALREAAADRGLPCNRRRLHQEDQLAVEFQAFPDARAWWDDFLMGFLVTDDKAVKAAGDLPFRRQSVLRNNLGLSLRVYQGEALLQQSPLNAGSSAWKNSASSALLKVEVFVTAFQLPLCFNLRAAETPKERAWLRELFVLIGEWHDIGGNQARHHFEVSPRSIVARLTPSPVVGWSQYGFDSHGTMPQLARLGGRDLPPDKRDLPAEEFWLGGELVRELSESEAPRLQAAGAKLYRNSQEMLAALAAAALPAELG